MWDKHSAIESFQNMALFITCFKPCGNYYLLCSETLYYPRVVFVNIFSTIFTRNSPLLHVVFTNSVIPMQAVGQSQLDYFRTGEHWIKKYYNVHLVFEGLIIHCVESAQHVNSCFGFLLCQRLLFPSVLLWT